MSVLIVPDVSHYQPTLTTDYPRDFVIFKATQGTTYLDSHFLANAGVCHSLHASGKLAGAVVYHVYTGELVSAQFAKIRAALGPTAPDWLAGIMIDLESWGGTSYALHGDHSVDVNGLYALLAGYLGSTRAAWIYANAGDFETLAPHRDSRAPLILAKYSSDLAYRTILGPSAIGQQYSDGETKWSTPTVDGHALPRYTPGLGNCDHNVFPGFASGAALREWMHPSKPKPTPPPEADVTPEQVTEMIHSALVATLKGDPTYHWNHKEHGDLVPASPDQGVFDRVARLEREVASMHTGTPDPSPKG